MTSHSTKMAYYCTKLRHMATYGAEQHHMAPNSVIWRRTGIVYAKWIHMEPFGVNSHYMAPNDIIYH